MRLSLLFASVLADLRFTCEQALTICYNGGFYIPPKLICTNDGCMDEDRTVCDHIGIFRMDQYHDNCSQKPAVGSIGSRNRYTRKWPKDSSTQKVTVPYFFDSSHSTKEKKRIRNAIEELSNWIDCVDIVEVDKDDTQANRIRVVNESGCWSYVGMTRGDQKLSLGIGCVSTGIIQHEFIHALGFGHEHTRADRTLGSEIYQDNYVTYHEENHPSWASANYKALPVSSWDSLGTRYEYRSVMHYGSYAFSNNGLRVLTTSSGGTIKAQRDRATSLDVLEICIVYQCGCASTNSNNVLFCDDDGSNPRTDEFFWRNRRCDGVRDCENGSDEVNCSGTSTSTTTTTMATSTTSKSTTSSQTSTSTTTTTTRTTTSTTTSTITTTTTPGAECCKEFTLNSIVFKKWKDTKFYKGKKRVGSKTVKYMIRPSKGGGKYYMIEQGTAVGLAIKTTSCPETTEWLIRPSNSSVYESYQAECAQPDVCDLAKKCQSRRVSLNSKSGVLYGLIDLDDVEPFAIAVPESCGELKFEHIEGAGVTTQRQFLNYRIYHFDDADIDKKVFRIGKIQCNNGNFQKNVKLLTQFHH